MTEDDDYAAKVLNVLQAAVAEALERKRRLGQYAVLWRDGRVVCIGPDAPLQYSPDAETARLATRAAEPGQD